jgi:hypothetical protein
MLYMLSALPLLAAASLAALEVYVGPGGNDANPGTAKQPFASFARGRDAARQAVGAGLTADVTVLMAAGTYELAEPLLFGPEDGGTAEHAVTYAAAPGAAPVLSGGRRISGWQRGEGNVWTATVPAVRAGTWYFHQLWVNGRRGIRARTPNADAPQPCFPLQGARLSEDLSAHTYSFTPGQLAAWKNLGDVEAVVFGNWEITRKHFAAVDAAAGVAQMAGPHAQPHEAMLPAAGRWCYLENAGEFLDAPGEWYLDRPAGVLSYWPRLDEDMATATVVAPVLTRLLEVRGRPGKPVRNLHFRGLEVAYSDWAIPPGGYLGIQASHFNTGGGSSQDDAMADWGRIEAAVRWEDAERCSFSDGALRHLGGAGLALHWRCQGARIEGNLVTDISANGINLGGPREDGDVPRDTRIANNHVHACGLDYAGAVGIWVGFAQRTVVAHNLVHDLPYTGISVGWQWDAEPTPARENVIEFNHIYDVMTRLGDGGGIYTLGLQPGSVIRGNHIHDIRRSTYAQAAPNNGIFFDQGSTGFRVEDNVIYATSGEPMRFNQTGPEALAWGENRLGLAAAAPGKVGAALHGDGSGGGIEVPHAPELDPPALTAEAWILLPGLVTEGDTRRWVINKNDDEWTAGHWGLLTDRDRVGAYLNIGGGEANMIEAWSTEKVLTVGAWQHVAFTYDGQDLRVYLDGRDVAATAVNRSRQPGTMPLAIGRRQDAYNVFLGDIDEVRLYSRALAAAEVSARAAAAGAPPPAGLPVVGYWGFDELMETAAVVHDSEARAGLEPAYRARLAPAP